MFKGLVKSPSSSVGVTLLAIQPFYTVTISKAPGSVTLWLHLILLDQTPYTPLLKTTNCFWYHRIVLPILTKWTFFFWLNIICNVAASLSNLVVKINIDPYTLIFSGDNINPQWHMNQNCWSSMTQLSEFSIRSNCENRISVSTKI